MIHKIEKTITSLDISDMKIHDFYGLLSYIYFGYEKEDNDATKTAIEEILLGYVERASFSECGNIQVARFTSNYHRKKLYRVNFYVTEGAPDPMIVCNISEESFGAVGYDNNIHTINFYYDDLEYVGYFDSEENEC